MMEFESAARRLQKDHSKLRRNHRNNPNHKNGGAAGSSIGNRNVVISSKAKREAEYRKKQQEQLRVERENKKLQLEYIQKYMTHCNRKLGVTPLTTNGGLQLQASSIYGDGDKITLPPSILEFLTQQMDNNNSVSSPWTFRIGILNPKYNNKNNTFPSSLILQEKMKKKKFIRHHNHDDDDMDHHSDDDDSDDHSDDDNEEQNGYLDELSYKYLSYTHGTVVEFTQEDGHVGLPLPIAKALLDKNSRQSYLRRKKNSNNATTTTTAAIPQKDPQKVDIEEEEDIPVTRTVDPATTTSMASSDSDGMSIDDGTNDDKEHDDKTPGHVAWGVFDIPQLPIEVSLVKLPKGKGCTLIPTIQAITNGFYNLKDIKLVLEQSLIRTRATLTVGDTVNSWHRGNKYELIVSSVLPNTFNAITCINTDIEVTIGSNEEFEKQQQQQQNAKKMETEVSTPSNSSGSGGGGGGYTLSGGRVLSSSTATTTTTTSLPVATTATLIEEPPMEQKDNICIVQIRTPEGKNGRRRFDIHKTKIIDLFIYASSILQQDANNNNNTSDYSTFQLVTRFPRKVFSYTGSNITMENAGIQSGQELFMVERI